MYGCESWTIKKPDSQRIDAFELCCWQRLLRVPWTARRSNQSIPKEISPGCSLEGLMLKLKPPVLWPPDVKSWLIGKDPDSGKDWGQAEEGTTEDEMTGWHHWLSGHELEQALGVGDGEGSLACCNPWSCKELESTELDWTTTNPLLHVPISYELFFLKLETYFECAMFWMWPKWENQIWRVHIHCLNIIMP